MERPRRIAAPWTDWGLPCERSRDETDRLDGLCRAGTGPVRQPRARRLERVDLQRLSTLLEHLRQALQVLDLRRRTSAKVLARLLRRPEKLLLRPRSHRLGGLLQKPRLSDQRWLRRSRRLLRPDQLRPSLRSARHAVGRPQCLHQRPTRRPRLRPRLWRCPCGVACPCPGRLLIRGDLSARNASKGRPPLLALRAGTFIGCPIIALFPCSDRRRDLS